MKESTTYQAILAEGREEGREEGLAEGELREAKKLLRVFGDEAFGPPDARTAASLAGMNDLAVIEQLCRRVRDVTNWYELLGQPAPARRSRRRPT